jgi:hypothetical protein
MELGGPVLEDRLTLNPNGFIAEINPVDQTLKVTRGMKKGPDSIFRASVINDPEYGPWFVDPELRADDSDVFIDTFGGDPYELLDYEVYGITVTDEHGVPVVEVMEKSRDEITGEEKDKWVFPFGS